MIFYIVILKRYYIIKNNIKINYFSKILIIKRRVSNINKPFNTIIFY
jgi:hypothetical protein